MFLTLILSCVCLYISIYASIHIHVHTSVCIHLHVHTYIHTYTFVYTIICLRTSTHTYIHVYPYVLRFCVYIIICMVVNSLTIAIFDHSSLQLDFLRKFIVRVKLDLCLTFVLPYLDYDFLDFCRISFTYCYATIYYNSNYSLTFV